MCNGASSRGSLLWYRPTSEKWHACLFRKPDMTAGYLVSLLHRCTTTLGKKRHQSYSSDRRQRRIISEKVFTVSLKKKLKPYQEKLLPRKSPEEPFCEESSPPGLLMVFAEESWQELCQGARATPSHGLCRPGHPQWPSARAGNQQCSVISLSFLSSLVK